MKLLPLASAALLTFSTSASSADYQDAMINFVTAQIVPWTSSDIITATVVQQNARTNSFGLGDILKADREWRTAMKANDLAVIEDLLSRQASDYVKRRQDAMGGIVSEIIITDAIGLNAAVSGPTSDYWQGDEAKFTQTYELQTDDFYISDIEFDDSTNTFQCQVSYRLIHPDTNQPIGTVTVGLNAENFL